MAGYRFMRGNEREMPELLRLVKAQGDVFTHDVLHEILLRYGRKIAEQEKEMDSLAERILLLEERLNRAKARHRG